MSTVSRMCIRGIRNFGIESGDEQKITFQSPLTLIVGANGCGKTTIIECLKYALTGEVPPGTNNGQLFVHDPKVYHTSECLGQVKLMVRDGRGNKITVTRSMKTAQKKLKRQFQTLDATIHFESCDGKVVNSISGRCLDVTKEMCTYMGVTKAIISNVILCHQEDSNWPLDEAKKLKEKFDAMFGTTEYNKAIERIIKQRKGFMEKHKDLKSTLAIREYEKADAEKKSMELHVNEEKLKTLQTSTDQLQKQMEPLRSRLHQIAKVETEISQMEGRRVALTTKIENCRSQQQSLQQKITTIWSGDIWSLEMEIRNFRETAGAKKQELDIVMHDLRTIKSKIERMAARNQELDTQRVTVSFQLSTEKDLFDERARYVQDICQRLAIRVSMDVANSQLNVQELLNDIKMGIGQQDQAVKAMAHKHDEADQQLQAQIDCSREAKTKIETEITAKRNLFDQTCKEQSRVDFELQKIEESAKSLVSILKDIERWNKNLENITQKSNIEELRQSLAAKKEIIGRLQPQLDKLDEDIQFLSSISAITGELALKKRTLVAKEAEFRRVKLKNADHMKTVFDGQTVESNFKQRVQDVYDKLSREMTAIHRSMQQKQVVATECKTKRVAMKDQLSRGERELAEAEEEIYEICKGNSYEELLERAKEKVAKLTLDVGAFENLKVINERYISKMQETPCCPLCANPMAAHDVDRLKQELADDIRNLPEKLSTTRQHLKIEQKNCDKLMAAGAQIEKVARLKEELPKLKTSLKTVEEGMTNALNDVENYEMELGEAKMKHQMANSMLGDMSLMDENVRSTAILQREIDDLQKKMPTALPAMTMEEAKAARMSTATELRANRESRETLEQEINTIQENMNKTRDQINQLNERKIQLQEQRQGFDQLDKRKAEIATEVARIRAEVVEVEARLPAATARMDEQVENKRRTKERNRLELTAVMDRVAAIKKIFRDIERCTVELQRLGEQNLTEQLANIRRDIEQGQKTLSALTVENERRTADSDLLKREIANQVTIERNLADNLDLKKLQTEEHKLLTDLDELQRDIGGLDPSQMLREKEEVNRKHTALYGKINTTQGQMDQLQEMVKVLKRELAEPKMKNSLANYMKVFYQVFVTGKMVDDLSKYLKVLENALTDFHKKKMHQINQLVKLYWREIYKGNDIDYICVKTESADPESATSEKRRSYNYRVVQCKNDAEIDMRGRCSAGQKVLASLIIRMALAETFSSNCAIFALDEPTTNLDRANITSLVEVLGRIIEERSRQNPNFMFIVITHDEDFVTALERVEVYYKLSRSHNGKSIIDKVYKY